METLQDSQIGRSINHGDSFELLLNQRRFQTDYEVAELLNLDVQTVRHWRLVGKGPKYFKIGRSVRYSPKDIAAYLESLPSGGGSIAARF
jgi:predicted DNA-binding transcriptional regulator AlpA